MSKPTLITGASRGIGRGLALALAEAGRDVVLCARDENKLGDVAEMAQQLGVTAWVLPMDVSDTTTTVEKIRRIDEEVGGLHTVVANAGIDTGVQGKRLRWKHCKRTIDVNVSGAVATLTAVLDRMVSRNEGQLVGISSLAQYRALPTASVYCASKAFLSTFLQSLRIDLHGTGVHVTDVRPGFVKTDMTSKNRYPMPFLLEQDEAGKIIARAVESQQPVCAFPWQLATAVRASTLLPFPLYRRLTGGAKAEMTPKTSSD